MSNYCSHCGHRLVSIKNVMKKSLKTKINDDLHKLGSFVKKGGIIKKIQEILMKHGVVLMSDDKNKVLPFDEVPIYRKDGGDEHHGSLTLYLAPVESEFEFNGKKGYTSYDDTYLHFLWWDEKITGRKKGIMEILCYIEE